MPSIMNKSLLLAALTLAFGVHAAEAHQIWIQREGGAAAVFYGEYADGHIEVTGGELDKIASPVLYLDDKAKPLTITRGKDRLEAKAEGKNDLRVVEAGLPPYPGRSGKTKYIFSGRAGRTETKAVNDCEIVPTSVNGNTFAVTLNGKPVAKAKVVVVNAEKWTKTFEANEKGEVTVPTTAKGMYLLEASVPEPKAGGEGEGAYAKTVHVVTLTFVVE